MKNLIKFIKKLFSKKTSSNNVSKGVQPPSPNAPRPR